MNDRLPLRATSFSRPLPEKKYFKIGEVASLVGVEPHVLRYWETQFPQVRPHKARSGHRLYRRREVEVLLVIKELLHVQRFTIAGARQALRSQPGLAQSLLPQPGLGGDTLPPMAADGLSGEGGDPTLDESVEGFASGDAEEAIESVDVEGLEGEELALAMEEQRHDRKTAGLVQVDLEARVDSDVAPVAPARVAPVAAPLARSVGPGLEIATRASARQKRLMEDALREAQGLLAFLDDLDARALHRAV
jgi:DNA-binding transcriptional MerR regulator